jgi:hypothetical protein
MSRLRPLVLAFSTFVLLLAGSTARAAADFPKPSPYPTAWELKFTHGVPKRIVVDVPTSPVPLAYWYVTYTVTNNTDKEQQWLPSFELLTENGQIVRANVNIPKKVFDTIKLNEHSKYLEPITTITGTIRLGEAESRDGVAIWPEPMPRMGRFSIFVSGLSGEAVTLKNINGKFEKVENAEEMKNTKDLIILRKTLQLNFFIRGDEVYPGEDEVNTEPEQWIMR